MSTSIAVIGECMLELSRAENVEGIKNPMSMSYGGDTINTSIYLARNGVNVSYITGLGDDINSDWLLDEWRAEGVDCSLVTRMENSVPGMYMINVDEAGERSFLYWRKGSPASRLFDNFQSAGELFASITQYQYVYLSGISLAILSDASRERLFALLDAYRQHGGKIVFDGNYRPNLWPDKQTAQGVYQRMYAMSDIALPTLEDEELLFGFTSAEQVMQAVKDQGVTEIVVKMGEAGCLSLCKGVVVFVEAKSIEPLDTTAAGDSFNAAYLAKRFSGNTSDEACLAGHSLAGKVIQHRGAIIPRV